MVVKNYTLNQSKLKTSPSEGCPGLLFFLFLPSQWQLQIALLKRRSYKHSPSRSEPLRLKILQAGGILPPASFRFHLAMDTLAFG
jgi:hypothetical protein